MDEVKTARLEAAGWKIGTVQEFLGLTDEEAATVDALCGERPSENDESVNNAPIKTPGANAAGSPWEIKKPCRGDHPRHGEQCVR